MNDLFYVFDFIYPYIDDLLVLTKRYCTEHLHNLELTLIKPKGEVLKCNIEKSFFTKTEKEYWGF